MKSQLACTIGLFVAGCVIPPSTTVRVTDSEAKPVSDFPIRIELGPGLSPGSLSDEEKRSQVSERSYDLRTDSEGAATISYWFDDRQPPRWRSRIFGAEWVPNRIIEVIPLEDLPSGSKITVGIPNP